MPQAILTKELILMDLKTLNHGGIQAITLFMNMARQLHEQGEKDTLRDWITIAAPSLPEKERNEIILMLMCSYFFLDHQTKAQNNSLAPSTFVH